jgi:hypothetical protein
VSADSHMPVKPAPVESSAVAVAQSPPEAGELQRAGFALWLHRFAILLLVFGCATVGMLLVILPWSPTWTSNSLLWGSPGWQAFVANSFVRGVCSGLGILDLWIGFSEAVHYHEGIPAPK